MAELLTAAQANEETNKMEQLKADKELEIVAELIRDAIHDGKYKVSTEHRGRLNWRTSDVLKQLGYSVQDWGDATLIEWEDIFTEYTNVNDPENKDKIDRERELYPCKKCMYYDGNGGCNIGAGLKCLLEPEKYWKAKED